MSSRPHIISQLVSSKRRPEYVNIFVDGEFALQVHVDLIYKHKILAHAELSEELKSILLGDKRRMHVRQLALSFATYKPRTVAQVRLRLERKECVAAEIDDAVEFLLEFKYLNDREFAEMFIRDYVQKRSSSSVKVRQELMKRGIAEHEISDAIASQFPHTEIESFARTAAAKKLKTVGYKPVEKQRNSVRDFLARQGFEWSLIRKVLDELFQEQKNA